MSFQSFEASEQQKIRALLEENTDLLNTLIKIRMQAASAAAVSMTGGVKGEFEDIARMARGAISKWGDRSRC